MPHSVIPLTNCHSQAHVFNMQVWNSFINTVIDTLHAAGPSIARSKVNEEPPPAVLPAAERLIAIGQST
jgi:hypothetical protein